ncbi:MobA/MobL family protein [Sphingomonas sp. 1P08PE]|uniref:MobA/MobL family protein n=1 Tax=Sphingomonas sp. 1P08PE TaxID=554122 RepID=UPI0039A33A4A
MTEALRRRIDWQEREALVGTIRPGRQRGGEGVSSRKSRWLGTINLQRPAPGARPMTADGRTGFHTRLSTIGKSGSASGSRSDSAGNPAVGQERYLTDNWARELSRAAGAERYVADSGTGEDAVGDPNSRVVFIHSNIADDGAERIAFWERAWALDRRAGAPRLRLNLTTMSEKDWNALLADPHAPSTVRSVAASLRSGGQSTDGRRFVRKGARFLELELGDADLGWARQIGTRFGSDPATRGVHFVAPRLGQVQKQFVAALPAELDAAAHRDIVTAFCAELDALGIPFTAALHAPDGYNHHANHHPHIIFYPAVCERDAHGRFDLASGRKLRPGELAGWTRERRENTHHRACASADATALRTRVAQICNVHLEQARSRRRYDPRRYEEMGLAAAPTVPLGKAASALVKAGIDVAMDRDNAQTYWSARKLDQANRARERRDHHLELLGRFRTTQASGGDRRSAALIEALASTFRRIEEGRDALDELMLQQAMARSAAERLADNCARLLEHIDAGRARAADVRERDRIAARHQLALAHLREIERAVAPYQMSVQHYEKEIERWEAEASSLRGQIALQQAWHTGSVLARQQAARPSPEQHFDQLVGYIYEQQRTAGGTALHVQLWRDDGIIRIRGLGDLDLALIADPRFASRAQRALSRAADTQAYGVGRLLRFVERHGLEGLDARLGEEGRAADAVRTLAERYSSHPLFVRGRYDAEVAFASRAGWGEEDRAGQPGETQAIGSPAAEPPTPASAVEAVIGLIAAGSATAGGPPLANWTDLDDDADAVLGAAGFYPRLDGEDDGSLGSIAPSRHTDADLGPPPSQPAAVEASAEFEHAQPEYADPVYVTPPVSDLMPIADPQDEAVGRPSLELPDDEAGMVSAFLSSERPMINDRPEFRGADATSKDDGATPAPSAAGKVERPIESKPLRVGAPDVASSAGRESNGGKTAEVSNEAVAAREEEKPARDNRRSAPATGKNARTRSSTDVARRAAAARRVTPVSIKPATTSHAGGEWVAASRAEPASKGPAATQAQAAPGSSSLLQAFRRSEEYLTLPPTDRLRLEEAAGMPLRYLEAGLATVICDGERLQLGFSSEAVCDSVRSLRDLSGGWNLLRAVAYSSPDETRHDPAHGWIMLERPEGGASAAADLGMHRRGSHER